MIMSHREKLKHLQEFIADIGHRMKIRIKIHFFFLVFSIYLTRDAKFQQT